jgi:hypothetical protein
MRFLTLKIQGAKRHSGGVEGGGEGDPEKPEDGPRM